MSRRTTAIAATLSLLALASPLFTGCTNPMAIEYFNQGVEKYRAENYLGAIDDYTKALKIDPQDSDAYYNRGLAKYDLEDYQGAIDDYNNAIEIDPQHDHAYHNRGVAKFYLQDYQGACDDWRKAVDLGAEPSAEWVRQQC